MEIKKLRSFMILAECLNFTRAAERLYIGQPALSRQIADLEEELGGVTLLTRTNRSVKLTPAGVILYQEAQEWLAHMERIEEDVKRAGSGVTGSLVVNFNNANSSAIMPHIKRFQERYPTVEVRFDLTPHTTFQAILDEHVDIGLVPHFTDDLSPLLSGRPLFNDSLCIAMAAKHPLANKKDLRLTDFKDETFILIDRDVNPDAYDNLIHYFKDAGFFPKIQHAPIMVENILLQIETGSFVTITLRDLSQASNQRLVYRELPEFTKEQPIDIIWKTDTANSATFLFLDSLEELEIDS